MCCDVFPSNSQPDLHDQALLCVTDLVDCCDAPHTVRGDWYNPDGHTVPSGGIKGPVTFLINRGPNGVVNGRQFYGSVRLFRRWSNPERGHYRCELPSAADPNVYQTLYVNICKWLNQEHSLYVILILSPVDFGIHHGINPVQICHSGPGIAGNNFSLTCSAKLAQPTPLPPNVPPPTFEWFYGPNNNTALPSGVILTSNFNDYTYTSTLQFSPLNQSHAGMYTCRLGAGQLINSMIVSVDGMLVIIAHQIQSQEIIYIIYDCAYNLKFKLSFYPDVVVQVTTSYRGSPALGVIYILTCNVFVADHLCPYITTSTYQWTKNNSTVTELQVGSESKTLSFSSLRLSDAGRYTCHTTVSSFRINDNHSIRVMGSHDIIIPSKLNSVCQDLEVCY